MFLPRLILSVSLWVSATGLAAHEFWIEPLQYQVDTAGTLEAVFKNGQEFKGNTLSYFDRSSARFEALSGETRLTIAPRVGDNPALSIPAPITDGLVSVVHETTPSFVTYTKWEKFMTFVAHKDFKTAANDHAAAGWSKARFKERYTRHAKALFAVGSGEGSDQRAGLKTEFVALTNPYAADFASDMKVALYYDGVLRPNAQVEVFDLAPDGAVTITLLRTDGQGQTTIPVARGHSYLLDAVVLEPAPDASTEEGATVWETYWAALTFAVPQ